jgi:hypothetical protein
MRSIILNVSVLCVLLAVGCRSTGNDSEPVWFEPVSNVGLVSVLPPEEDLRVGDLFVQSTNPEAPGTARTLRLRSGSRWGTLKLLDDLEVEYEHRRSWPRTPDDFLQISTDPDNRVLVDLTTTDGASMFSTETPPNRLRIVGVDAVAAATATGPMAGAFIPTEAVNIALGTSWYDEKAVTLKLGPGEAYSISTNVVLEALLEPTRDEQGRAVIKPEHRRNLSLLSDPGSNIAYLRVLTEVVYIRSLDISIQAKRKAREDDDLMDSDLVTLVVPESTSDPDPASDEDAPDAGENEGETNGEEPEQARDGIELSTHELDPILGAFARAYAINRVLINSDADDVPRGFVRFLAVTDDSVSIRRIWQRGLAIAVRGLTFEIDAETGAVLRCSTMGQPMLPAN